MDKQEPLIDFVGKIDEDIIIRPDRGRFYYDEIEKEIELAL